MEGEGLGVVPARTESGTEGEGLATLTVDVLEGLRVIVGERVGVRVTLVGVGGSGVTVRVGVGGSTQKATLVGPIVGAAVAAMATLAEEIVEVACKTKSATTQSKSPREPTKEMEANQRRYDVFGLIRIPPGRVKSETYWGMVHDVPSRGTMPMHSKTSQQKCQFPFLPGKNALVTLSSLRYNKAKSDEENTT